jgi:hypothetical protein
VDVVIDGPLGLGNVVGESLALPAALALVGALTGVRPDPRDAATGALEVSDGQGVSVRPVGRVEEKRAVLDSGSIRRLVCPADWPPSDARLVPVRTLDEAVEAVFGRRRLTETLLAAVLEGRPASSVTVSEDLDWRVGRPDARALIDRFLASDASALALTGPPGRGKSDFAAELCRDSPESVTVVPIRLDPSFGPRALHDALVTWPWFGPVPEEHRGLPAETEEALSALEAFATELGVNILLCLDGYDARRSEPRRRWLHRWVVEAATVLARGAHVKLLVTTQIWTWL